MGNQTSLMDRRSFMALSAVGFLGACTRGPRTNKEFTNAIELISASEFYIAHRGSGDNWIEHTQIAYDKSLEAGAQAIEISVHRLADGTFVCHHDANLFRLTGVNAEIATLGIEELGSVRNNARQWLGPNTALEPIPLLTEVLRRLNDRCVIFIEDKTGNHGKDLLDLISQYPAAAERFIWKQPANAPGHRLARERGFLTWGYFAPSLQHELESLAPALDLIGMHISASDESILAAVRIGKPVIIWEIHTRAERDRVISLGARGLMCSNYPYVARKTSIRSRDEFGAGARPAGDLPDTILWERQPSFVVADSALRISGDVKSSYCMGSVSGSDRTAAAIACEVRWNETAPKTGVAGLSYGVKSDAPYRAFEVVQHDGFHLQIASDGTVSTWQAAGNNPIRLGMCKTEPPLAGQWIRLTVQFGVEQTSVHRDGLLLYSFPALPQESQGFISLLNLVGNSPALDFRKVFVSQ